MDIIIKTDPTNTELLKSINEKLTFLKNAKIEEQARRKAEEYRKAQIQAENEALSRLHLAATILSTYARLNHL